MAEGRTVVLSSHLLDEVERTCDAVAIVDRGKVIRQGPIAELLAGSSFVLQVECSEPDGPAPCWRPTVAGPCRGRDADGLGDHPPGGHRRATSSPRSTGVLVEGGISVYRLQEVQASLESWFLQVTSRLGAPDDHRDRRRPAGPAGPAPAVDTPSATTGDRWVPTGAMIATRFMELRKRRGLMIALVLVNIGLPIMFLAVRLLAHAFDPKSYGPAGGYDIYTRPRGRGDVRLRVHRRRHLGLHGGVGRPHRGDVPPPGGDRPLAAGALPGADPRRAWPSSCPWSRPASPSSAWCASSPLRPTLNYDGVNVPAGLSRAGLENWAAGHADEVVCNFGLRLTPSTPGASEIASVMNNLNCGGPVPPNSGAKPTQAQIRAAAVQIARQNYSSYASQFLYPSDSLMIKSGLWLELEALIGLLVGLGLASLLGQRTISVILMIVLEVVLTPIFSRARIPHLLNLQRAVVGVATAHLAPGGLSRCSVAAEEGRATATETHSSFRSRPPWPSASSSPGWSSGRPLAPGG